MDAYQISRFSGINKIVTAFALMLLVSSASADQTTVTLKDGKTYQVETASGLPIRFMSEQIRVQALGMTARFLPNKEDAPPFVRVLVAELLEEGKFSVTITTPLDKSATATLQATGPGRISLRFFPQADYPLVWEGIDQPGVHWFPFHFVFEEKQSKKRFEFTQWAQMDDRTWKETSEQIEKVRQLMHKR